MEPKQGFLLDRCRLQAGTNYILPVHELSCTQRCLQRMIVRIKVVYSCRRRALEQK